MNKIIFSCEDERKYALACLTFAKRMSLISDDSLDALYDRCNKENENRKKVKTVIYKKIREEEYENEINGILRQLS